MLNNLHLIVKTVHKIFFLVFLSFLISCQDVKKVEKPEDLIPEDKMIDVLTELSLVHAARNYDKSRLEQTGIDPEVYIYEKFGIDSLQFKRSNAYYADQYQQYERMYDSVKIRLQVMKSKLDSIRDIEIRIEDSIKLAKKDSLNKIGDSLDVDQDSLKSPLKRSGDSLMPPPPEFKRLDSIED